MHQDQSLNNDESTSHVESMIRMGDFLEEYQQIQEEDYIQKLQYQNQSILQKIATAICNWLKS